MYNMQAVVRKCINNATTQFDRLGYIANNVANYNTIGYKTVRFEQLMREDGYVDGALRTNCASGSIKVTNNQYDIAIDGAGYIPVVSPDGEIQYTRDGSFKRGADGYLVTTDDWLVGDGIKIPANSYKFEIKPNGDVLNYDNLGSLPEKIGTIPIVQFDCPESLDQGHNNKMVVTEESGNPRMVKNENLIKQYAIETSNTNIYDEIDNLMRLNTSMIASMNLMKVADDMYTKAINLRE
ncbi:MAG: flagellar hook basal-body protein [Cyanobacteria bacterium SIG28]|nr:flagellar hook basal-body protein [Cyanobacteria bacterium SIG28]